MEKRNKLQDTIKKVQKLYKESGSYKKGVSMQILGEIRADRKVLNKNIRE